MAVTEYDLRIELGYEPADWTADDANRATAIIGRCLTAVRAMAGPHRVDKATADGDTDRLAAVDEATLVLAVARFSNPEKALQRRHGQDNSVSYSDSSEAAGGRKEARDIVRDAFGQWAGTTTL